MNTKVKQLCPCGSGLRPVRCCSMNLATVTPPESTAALRPMVEQAARAYEAGRREEAERVCLEVLELSPGQPGALWLLYRLRREGNVVQAAENLLRRLVALDPNNYQATLELAHLLFAKAAFVEAEIHARNTVRLAPRNPQSHNIMGMIMTEANRPQIGEFHYRKVMELREPEAILFANLAWNLKNQGRMEESREYYQKSIALNDQILQSLIGYARMEETDRNFDEAETILEKAEKVAPGNQSIVLTRAIISGRKKDYEQALELLAKIESEREEGGLGPNELLEKGRLLDKLGRFDEAWQAYEEGKRKYRELSGNKYLAQHAEQLVNRLKSFFQRSRLAFTPRGTPRSDCAQPIFVTGFMRSGTTMLEQTLSAHPSISAGDELPIIADITGIMPRMLNSPLGYPEALSDLWMGDQQEGLNNLRDYYLQRARQMGAMEEGADWFTDKMPLNEAHFGLLSLTFPESPILHVLRHPLDVILSVFANHMTHGFFCSYELETAAKHYMLIYDLIEHYKSEVDLKMHIVRYEDVVRDQENHVRAVLDFVGVPFDKQCLKFHENRRYARTASYAQVTEELYDTSIGRYRHYIKHLEPVIPVLEPAIKKLGYEI